MIGQQIAFLKVKKELEDLINDGNLSDVEKRGKLVIRGRLGRKINRLKSKIGKEISQQDWYILENERMNQRLRKKILLSQQKKTKP